MVFDYETIIRQQTTQIEELVTWIYAHTRNDNEFRKALEECHIPEEDIEGYMDC